MRVEWWGLSQPYGPTLERQRAHREALLRGEGEGLLALLEHTPVITTGRRETAPLPPGVEVFRTERGGLATWHGPGQLVGYLLCDVWALGHGARSTVCAVEGGLIAFLAELGLQAGRRDGLVGVWAQGRKLAAVGMHFKRGHSLHGFSLNLRVDPGVWSAFSPCGMDAAVVGSAHQFVPSAPSPREAADRVGAHVLAALLGGG